MAEKFRDTITIKFKPDGDKELTNAIKKLDEATRSLLNSQAKLVDKEVQRNKTIFKGRNQLKAMFLDLKKVDSGFREAGVSTELFTRALKGDRVALRQVREATKKLVLEKKKLKKGMLDTEHSTRILGGSLAVARSKMLLFNFALGLGIKQISALINRSVQASSKVTDMATAFDTLQESGTNSGVALEKLIDATDGTMTQFDLFQQANNAMILGVTNNADAMAEMFDIAQRLGQALGKDTKLSVESLITGIGRQSRMMLDNIGIVVKSEEAYEAYAEELGVTKDDLTDVEKKQAFLNATMDAARAKVAALGEEALSDSQKMQQLSTSVSNLSVAFGHLLESGIGRVASGLASFIDDVTYLVQIMGHSTSGTYKFTEALDESDVLLARLNKDFGITTKSTSTMIDRLKDARTQLEELGKGAKDTNDHFTFMGADWVTDLDLKALDRLIVELTVHQKDYLEAQQLTMKAREASMEMEEQRRKAKEHRRKAAEKEIALEEAKAEAIRKERLQQEMLLSLKKEDMSFFTEWEQQEIKKRELKRQDIEATKELTAWMREQFAIMVETGETIESRESFFTSFFGTETEISFLTKQQENSIRMARQFSNTIGQAAINGQNMGEAVVSSLKAISAQIIADIAIYAILTAITGGPSGAFATGTSLTKFLFGHSGGLVTAGGIQKFHSGGLAGDEQPAILQRGEFVMSKSAVESIGLETLNQMNRGGGAGVTVNISGGIVQEDYVSNTLIPEINRAVSLGSRINA